MHQHKPAWEGDGEHWVWGKCKGCSINVCEKRVVCGIGRSRMENKSLPKLDWSKGKKCTEMKSG